MIAQLLGPRISVLTPCLNGGRYVGDAIESVLKQGYPNTEHVVADGGSTDETLRILSRYSHLKILSSPDDGMYDALNRALAVAEGEVIGILNSDDCYADDVFSSVIDAFGDDSVMAVAGDAATFNDTASDDRISRERFAPTGSDLLFRSTLGNPSINAWFFRKSVFAKIGRFDSTYRVAGDRDFMLRFALSGLRFVETKQLICRYRMHSESMTFGGNEAIWDTILREHNRLTNLYLCKPTLPKRARALIKEARTRDTLLGAFHSARRYDLRGLLLHAAAGTTHDAAWPARFAKRAMYLLARKIGLRDQRQRT